MHRSESGLFSREFLVEVTDVAGRFLDAKVKVGGTLSSLAQKDTHDLGEVWRRNPLVDNIIPIDVFKEGMAFDFFCVAFTRAQPPGWVSCQKLHDRSLLCQGV
jgi:hypothetical protein